MQFENPVELHEAYSILETGDWKILAGGTDFYPSLNGEVPKTNVLDITNLKSINGIYRDENGDWHIGALTTWTDVIEEDLPPSFDGLKLSAREVGSVQIQNRATIVGNICNASPAADGVPPLLTLGAQVKIGSLAGERRMPLSEFIQGSRKTALKPGEIVIGIFITTNSTSGVSSFLKLGARKYLVISISMVAARIHVIDGRISDAALAVGSCSQVAQRLSALESLLVGREANRDIAKIIKQEHFASLAPIDDVRATKNYRMHAAKEMVERVLFQTLDTMI
jgi:CO/xanthine dehydrogenase FAD-binding subunit